MDSNPVLTHLAPDPAEEWQRVMLFCGPDQNDRQAMARTVEILMKSSTELVVNTYDYLRSVPETAAILGWEEKVDQEHLEERRRFFTIWLSRTLGIDTSDEFAFYLFHAGHYHAGHGPRQIHTPPAYITGSIGLVLATFAHNMDEANLPGETIAKSLAGWTKYLQVQLNQMLFGYQIAIEFSRGEFNVPVNIFGTLRPVIGKKGIEIPACHGDIVEDMLRKFFNYFPATRKAALERVWHSEEKPDSKWVDITPTYSPRRGWRFLLNGREVGFIEGFNTPITENDKIDIFPPGR